MVIYKAKVVEKLLDNYLSHEYTKEINLNPVCFLCQFEYSPHWFPVTIKRNGVVSNTEDSPKVCLRCFVARKFEKPD